MRLKHLSFLKEVLYKTGDNQFYNAIKVTFCALLTFLLFYDSPDPNLAFSVTLGAILCAPIDSNSSLKHKIIGLSLATILIPSISIILTSIYTVKIIFVLVFLLFVFCGAIISLYGLRANQLSFTLLLGISLSFIHHDNPEIAIQNGVLMFYGGLMYMLISVTFYFIMPSRYINLEVSDCIEKVSEYFELRAQLWKKNPDIESIKHKQLEQQVEINESLNRIREYLVFNKSRTINSNDDRKSFAVLYLLNDIMELALSANFSAKEIKNKFDSDPEIINNFNFISINFALTLKNLSNSIKLLSKYKSQFNLADQFIHLTNQIDEYCNQKNWKPNSENKIATNNVMLYLEKQIEKVKRIESVFTESVKKEDVSSRYKDLESFFMKENYRMKTLFENLNFKSAYFRYALRMTIAMLVGLLFGFVISVKNEYWILLTIVVILRPGYGLTKSRTKNRVIGTIIGGFIGFVVLYFVKNTYVLGPVAVLSMLLGYWFSNSNYKIGVTFVTLYIVIFYGILNIGAESKLIFRIIDTFIGAFIAFMAANYLWPFWEFNSTKKILENTINSSIEYINEVKKLYIEKDAVPISYRLARKNAFVAVGNLMAAYQRLIQEPKNKQHNRVELYEITVLNQSLLAATASVGIFIQAHETSKETKIFRILTKHIIMNLSSSLAYLDSSKKNKENAAFNLSRNKLKDIINEELLMLESMQNNITQIEEIKLVVEQLIKMRNISEQIEKTARNFN